VHRLILRFRAGVCQEASQGFVDGVVVLLGLKSFLQGLGFMKLRNINLFGNEAQTLVNLDESRSELANCILDIFHFGLLSLQFSLKSLNFQFEVFVCTGQSFVLVLENTFRLQFEWLDSENNRMVV